jgi:hypothetical protein
MAMIICSECGNEVSDQAITCPKCGVNQNSIEIIKKIRENRQDPCKNNLPNLIHECDELAKPRWYQSKVLFVLSILLLFVGVGLLIIGILIYFEYRGYIKLKEARYRALPCLKKIYFIIDESIITSKFEYVLRNEKFTAGAKYKEILDYLIYSKAYKLGADAIVIHNQDTSTVVSGSVSTSTFSKNVSGYTSTIVFDNVYVSYVKLKD